MKIILLILISFASFGQKIIYVGGSGAGDANSGTITQPYATIQKASSVAVAGDIVKIRSGTYRETIIPTNSGTTTARITYQPDQGATVVISGLNEAGNSGWTVHSGSIYKKLITLPVNGHVQHFSTNTALGANQLFRNGVMQIEARWPKISTVDDQLNRLKIRQRNSTSNWTATNITDSGIPNIPGGWGGGKIWMTGWFIAQTRVISSSSGTTITFPYTNGDMRFSQYYYLTGKLGALTQAKEWHYENGTLYFWQEGGGNPTDVEYKARNWGFDLRGKSNITIQGINFVGCEINSDVNSLNTVVDGIKASYTNQTFLQGGGTLYTNALQTGMKIIGTGSVIKNSELKYGASQALWLGQNCTAENNLITDFNWEGNYAAGISCWGNTGGQVMTRNTIARMGRSALDFGTTLLGKHINMDIGYNDMYDCLMLSSDGGTIYASIDNDLTGSRFHHNWIHDSKAARTPSVGYTVGICAGMYLDQASGPVVFDHNVLWNNYECDFHTWQDDRKHRNAGKSYIWNNVFATNATDGWYSNKSYLTIVDWFFDEMRNNIFRDMVSINWIPPTATYGDVKNCIQEQVNPLFVNTGQGGLAYRVQPGSPGVDKGVLASGTRLGITAEALNAGAIGTPDIGAYEVGGVEWVPGYKPGVVVPPIEPPIPPVIVTTPKTDSTFILNGDFTISTTGRKKVTITFQDAPATKETKIYDDLVSTKYSSGWTFASNSCCGWNLNTLNFSTIVGSSLTFTFNGSNVKWFAERKRSSHGRANVILDNKDPVTINLGDSDQGVDHITKIPSWDSGPLAEGNHTLTITVIEPRYVVHDYFLVEFNK